MPVISHIAALSDEVTVWRRDFHQHPELLFDVYRTAGVVAQKLQRFGCDEVVTGVAKTGVIGVIKGRKPGRVIGLRADMDALPIHEITGLPYQSSTSGKMHACGHDGHTAMLLGAAQYLCETRNFAGTVMVIFQPAEEGGGGGEVMVREGVMERFHIEEVYGMHNMPGLPVGSFAIRSGSIMAAADRFTIDIEGKGGHAARPHDCIDPVLVAGHLITALQSIVSRNVDPLESAVISVCKIEAGDAFNVIPQTSQLLGTARSLTENVRDLCEARINVLANSICAGFGAKAKVSYARGYPVTHNHPEQTAYMVEAATDIVGKSHVDANVAPMMGAEDFSYMLQRRPGAYILLGNGESAGLHHPAYNFNDEAIPYGVSLWARLVEQRLMLSDF